MSEKTKILKVMGDWKDVVDDCRATVGKKSLGSSPSVKFRQDILIAEHSPIRNIIIKWEWPNMPHWVTVHWLRHKWEKFIRTQRSDRTGVDRTKLPQNAPQSFIGMANTQHLIDTMRKRLCYQSSKETREYAEDLKKELLKIEPEVSNVLVPNCVYRCGCPEINRCGFWNKFVKSANKDLSQLPIQSRYELYNAFFYDWMERK